MGAAAAPGYPDDHPPVSAAVGCVRPSPTGPKRIGSGSPEPQLPDTTEILRFGHRTAEFLPVSQAGGQPRRRVTLATTRKLLWPTWHLKPPPTELFGIESGSPERQLLDATLIGRFGYRSAEFGQLPWRFRVSASGCKGVAYWWGAQLPPTTLRQSLEGSLPPSPWLISLLHHGLALCRGPPAVNSVVRQLHRPTTNTAAVLPKPGNNMSDNPMFSHCPAELVEELVANSSLPEEQRRSPRDWLQLLITCASQYPEWDKELPLLELGRRLARREALDGLSDEEAMSYWTSLDKLAATFQTSQSCGALTRSGKRCQVPGPLTCGNARHKSQGMPLLVRDRDGESGHTRTGDFVCQGCGEDGDDHAEPGELSCRTSTGTVWVLHCVVLICTGTRTILQMRCL